MVKFVVTGSRTEVIRGQKRRHAELLFNGGRITVGRITVLKMFRSDCCKTKYLIMYY